MLDTTHLEHKLLPFTLEYMPHEHAYTETKKYILMNG